MKGSRKRWIGLGCAALLVGVAVWTYPFWNLLFFYAKESLAGKKEYQPHNCLSNLKQVGQALNLYLEANDAYPPADRWMDELVLYMHADNVVQETQKRKFACPVVGDGETRFGYAFNGEIGTKWSDELAQPAETPAAYDSTQLQWNAHDPTALASLPNPPRHGQNNIVYADGHAASEARK